MQTIHFTVPDEHAPALLAAIEEICDTLATRVEGKFTIPTEQALSRAIAALIPLRVEATHAVQGAYRDLTAIGKRDVPYGPDPDYTRER